MKAALTPESQDTRRDGLRPEREDNVAERSGGPAGAAPGAPLHAVRRSDAETLKEIARQIREGELKAPFRRYSVTRNTVDADAKTSPADSEVIDDAEVDRCAPAHAEPSNSDADHLAKLAHELKTPISAIAAAAEIMRDERLGKMQNERYLGYAADIHESATHALDVIASLLSQNAKTKTNAPQSALANIDLNAVVNRTVSSMQALAASRGLLLAFDADRGGPHVAANPTALRQILLNLLANAMKFTPPGGDVRVVTGYLDDGRVFLVVRDTGCGMNGDIVAPESHTNENFSRAPQGNGIGLPLVQRLVREMGARIEIDSAPEKGTVVLIVFGRPRGHLAGA